MTATWKPMTELSLTHTLPAGQFTDSEVFDIVRTAQQASNLLTGLSWGAGIKPISVYVPTPEEVRATYERGVRQC